MPSGLLPSGRETNKHFPGRAMLDLPKNLLTLPQNTFLNHSGYPSNLPGAESWWNEGKVAAAEQCGANWNQLKSTKIGQRVWCIPCDCHTKPHYTDNYYSRPSQLMQASLWREFFVNVVCIFCPFLAILTFEHWTLFLLDTEW